MDVYVSLSHKNLILLLGMGSCNEHEKKNAKIADFQCLSAP